MGNGKDRGRQSRQVRSAMVRLHRWVGLFAFVILLGIAVTGVLLNHSAELDLDGKTVTRPWVMSWYGMEPEGEAVIFEAGGRRIAGWEGMVFFDEEAGEGTDGLVGAAPLGEEIAIVMRDGITMRDGEGRMLERVSGALLPDEPIEAVALAPSGGGLVLRAGGRAHLYLQGVGVVAYEGAKPSWIEGRGATEGERQALLKGMRGEGLPLSRVLLDLHSGKIFGTAGVIVYDVAAIAVLALSATGVWLAVRNFYRSRFKD